MDRDPADPEAGGPWSDESQADVIRRLVLDNKPAAVRIAELERALAEARCTIDAVCVQMDEMIHDCCGPAWANGGPCGFCESYGCSTLAGLRAALGQRGGG